MNVSQASCSELYECSCPELDTLTQLCRTSGAYGSRLTGAGWGGCTISLVAEDQVGEFVRKLKEGYEPYQALSEEELGAVVFATRPSNGAFGALFFGVPYQLENAQLIPLLSSIVFKIEP